MPDNKDPLGILSVKSDPLGILSAKAPSESILQKGYQIPEFELGVKNIPQSKYDIAVQDDRNRFGKSLSTLYNGIVGSFERTVGGVLEAAAQYPTAGPSFSPTDQGVKDIETFKQVPIAQRIEVGKGEKAKVEKITEKVRSGYTTRKEEEAIKGQFDITDGVGLKDLEGLFTMSGGMAVDMGLGSVTGGSSFIMQGFNDALEDYDNSIESQKIQVNENARGLYGVAGGVINGILEKFALDKMFGDGPVFKNIQRKVLSDVFLKTSQLAGKKSIDVIEELAKAEVKKLTSSIKANGIRAASRAFTESSTEMIQTGLEESAKLLTNKLQNGEAFDSDEISKGFVKNILNAGVAGGIFGAGMGYGVDKVFGRNINNQLLTDIANAKTEEDLLKINDELSQTFDKNNFSQAERDIILNSAKRYSQIKQTIPEDASPEIQENIIKLIDFRSSVDKNINDKRQSLESVDESIRPSISEDILILEDKKAQVNDEISENISGNKFTYYEDNGKYFKKLGENTSEEISKNRFELEELKKKEIVPTETIAKPLVMPSADTMAQETKDGKVVTYTYATQDEIPEEFKNRITDIKTENGKNVITVSVPLSLDNYIKAKQNATTTSQGQEQEVATTGDISQREGTQGEQDQATTEANIGYSFIVSEEGDEVPIAALINKKVRVNGQPAILYQEGERIVARVLGTNRILDTFGNYKEMMNALPSEYGIEIEDTIVSETPTGYRVGKDELVNNNENKLDAISVDGNGKVMNVVLYTPSGKRRKFRDKAARDLAYQIRLKEILQNEEQFEEFLESEHRAELDAAAAKQQQLDEAESKRKAELDAREAEDAAKRETDGDNGTVSETAKVKPAYGVITPDNLDELDKIKGNKIQTKVLNDIKGVVRAIAALVNTSTGKNLTVSIHNQETFTQAIIEAGGTKQDATARGFYMSIDGSIHLNFDNLATDTMLHEGFHPVLDFLEKNNPKIINEFFAQLEAIPGAKSIIKKARRDYSGDITQKKEAITDFVAAVADGRVQLDATNTDKFYIWLNNIFNKIGLGSIFPKLIAVNSKNSRSQLVQLAEGISSAFTNGNEITPESIAYLYKNKESYGEGEQGLVMAAGVINPERIQQSKVGNTNPLQFSKTAKPKEDKFKKVDLVTLPVKSMQDVYNEFGGRAIAINSDPSKVGNLKMPSGKEIFMYGGPNYTAIKENVDGEIGFASTRISKPEQVSKFAKNIFPDMNGEGLVLVATQKPESMLGDAYALEYTLDAISELPKSQLRSSKFKDEFFGGNLLAVKEAFGEDEYKEFIKKFRGSDLSNPDVIDDMINRLLTDIGNNFIARNSLVSNMLAGVVKKSTRKGTIDEPGYLSQSPNKFISKQLFDRFGLNQEKLFYEIGENGLVSEYMNKGNWGFVTTGFTTDGNIDPNNIQDKGVVHPQFNAKFHGKNPFLLDGAYLIDKIFPSEEIITSKGKPYTKKASLMLAASMYPKGNIQRTTSPDAEGLPQFQRVAPNGKPSKLNAKQYEQVRTPAFKKWFGDWEKDPKNASQVVDKETGEPKIMYHGGRIFDEFNIGEGFDKGIYFTDNIYFAEDVFANSIEIAERTKKDDYTGVPESMLEDGQIEKEYFKYAKVYEVFLNIKNPKVVDAIDAKDIPYNYGKDNDGFIAGSTGDFGYKGNQIVIFDPNQAKSATDNTGEFSTEDNRIQFQKVPAKTKLGNDYVNAIEKAKTESPETFWSVDRPFQDEDGNIDGAKLDKAVKEGRVVRTEAGFGVVDNGDIKGVFKADLTSSEKTGDKVIQEAVKKGGVKLDNFALPNLMKIYERNGFRETSRLPFNKEYAPEGWTEKQGTPDVVAMVYDPNKELDIEKKEFTDYDEAMQYRDSFLPQFQRSVPTKKLGLNTKSDLVNRFTNKAERIRQNLFTVSGVLGKTVKTLQEKMAGNLAAEINKAERLGGKTKKLIEKYKNVITAQQVTDYLTGVPPQPGTSQMPPTLAMALDEMREHIDGLTEQLITLGVIDNADTIALYRENKGKYMLRSYELFNAPTGLLDKFNGNKMPEIDIDNAISKLRNVDQAVIDNALMYLANQEMPRIQTENPTLSLAEQFKLAKEAAKTLVNEILGRDEVGYSTKSVAGSVNVKSIIQRQDIAPEIRALMGEYTDPIYNYYSTIYKIASLTSSRDYLNKLKDVGYNKFLFDKNSPSRPTGSNARIAAEESEFLRPLNGLYTFPEMANALKAADAETQNIIRQLAGRVRKYKTVYNPATHVVNVIGNAGFAMSNGHWNELPETYKALAGYLSGSDSPKIVKLIDTLNREGVLGNSVGVNELKQYFDKNKSLDDLLKVTYGAASKVEKVAKGLKKARMAVEKAYQIEDDVFKILAFVNESNRYAKAIYNKRYMDLNDTQMADISDRAGEIVKNTYPTWSRVAKFVKVISKELFLGNFLSFPAESIRTSYNTLELAMKELASGNGKLRTVGFTRLVGTLAYNGVFTALNYYGFSLAGAGITGLIGAFADDDEERKKKKQIMQQVAPWNQESADLYISSFKNGKLVYYDIGRLNSFKYQSDVFGTFFTNMGNKEGAIKSSYRTVAKALEPVFDVDLTYDALIAMKNNEIEGTGQKIYNPEQGGGDFDKSTNRSIAYGKYMIKKFSPGIITNAMNMYDYYGKDSDKFKDEVVSTFGPRKYTVDLTQNFYFNLKGPSRGGANNRVGFVERLEDAKRLYNKYDTSLSEGEKEVKYQEAIAAYKRVLADAREYYRGAIAGGAKPEDLITKLKISKIGGGNDKVAIGTIMRDDDMSLSDNAYIIR